MDWDPKVKPETCVTPGCTNQPAAFVLAGEVVYSPLCSACQHAIELAQEEEFQEQVRQNQLRTKWMEMGIPKLFLDENFKTFRTNENNLIAYEKCLQYAEEFELGKTAGGIILLGSTGAGKTHLACSVLKSVGEGFIVNQSRLMQDQRATFARDWENVQGHLDRCLDAPLLVLDDIASDTMQESTMQWLRDMMYQITNTRFEEGLPTIVTSNTTMGAFAERLGNRVVSRLNNKSVRVSIQDVDHRTGF